jgi:hypothetical protein
LRRIYFIPLILLSNLCLVIAAFCDPLEAPVRGVIISTHGGGRDWGNDTIVQTIMDIRDVGANWVSIHPYARIRGDGSVHFRDFDPQAPPEHIVRPIREAHALGMRICIKPHLAYWRSPFSWRGEITFSDDESWETFWAGYRLWILKLAEACKDADVFVVGTELDKTLHMEDKWRDLIWEVRAISDVPLTYGANWTDYDRVPFWDALDMIGIQAYFPIADSVDAGREELESGWSKLMDKLRKFGEDREQRILFTELGYNRSLEAAVKPWEYRVDGEEAVPVQADCFRVALKAIEQENAVLGVLLWKWFPNPRPVGRNFQLATPLLKEVISEAWKSGK